ncbi:MAG: DUF3772 domain-containing protein [Halocynthiibacter sp.]
MKHLRFLICYLFLVLAGGLALQSGAWAQDAATGPDFAQWARTEARAEEAVNAGRASDLALEQLRAEISDWRSQFLEAQSGRSSRIQTLQGQLEALGAAPEEGTEPEDIAARRRTLNDQLAAAQAPGLRAEEAFRSAEGLIGRVDQIISDRQTAKLLKLGPSPLSPGNWASAGDSLADSFRAIRGEITVAWGNPIQRAQFRSNTLAMLFFGVVALAGLLRGRAWMVLLSLRLQSHNPIAWRWLLGFVISLGQILLPLVGLIALTELFYASGLVGLRGDILLSALPLAGLAVFVAHWLGVRIFPRQASDNAHLNLGSDMRAQGRWLASGLGLLVGLNIVLGALARFDDYTDGARVVLVFPILALVGLMNGRLGLLMLSHCRRVAQDEGPNYRRRLIRLLGRAVLAVSAGGVALGAIGYMAAAENLVFPAGLTLALLAFLLILQRLVAEVYGLLSGNRDGAREALVPVLISFVLIVAAAPVLALIWGARAATLSDFWDRFVTGVALGDTVISPLVFLTLAIVFVVGYALTRLLQGALSTTVLPKTNLDAGVRNAIISGVGYVGIFLAALMAITSAGIDLSSLAIVAGALSVGIGFGLQNIVSNFVSGIILLIERPISEGDWIEVGGNAGYVREISVRSTRIETFNRADVIVPNADLISGVVLNMTKGNLIGRVIVPVGVAYGTDTRRVEEILLEIAKAHPMVSDKSPPGVVFQGFGADSLDFEIRAILRDINWVTSVRSDMNHEIARRFGEEGIEIPFAQRDVWLRNPEALRGPAPALTGAQTEPGNRTESVPKADDSAGSSRGESGDGGRAAEGNGTE